MSEPITVVDDEAGLLRAMQVRRLQIVQDILDERDSEGKLIPHNKKDTKVLKVALTAMADISKDVINRQRLDLDKQQNETSKNNADVMGLLLTHVLQSGGLALANTVQGVLSANVPTPKLDALPPATFAEGETLQGVEHIEYDDIMHPTKTKA